MRQQSMSRCFLVVACSLTVAYANQVPLRVDRAELGRASWKLFHTMMARFPEKPTPDESLALKTYITLFARLYPCGDCARHFQQLLAKYPPQVSGRNAASGWACLVHNEVNKRLKKPEFDCTKLDYDCGCGDDEKRDIVWVCMCPTWLSFDCFLYYKP